MERKVAISYAICPLYTYSICYWEIYRYLLGVFTSEGEGSPWDKFLCGRSFQGLYPGKFFNGVVKGISMYDLKNGQKLNKKNDFFN